MSTGEGKYRPHMDQIRLECESVDQQLTGLILMMQGYYLFQLKSLPVMKKACVFQGTLCLFTLLDDTNRLICLAYVQTQRATRQRKLM